MGKFVEIVEWCQGYLWFFFFFFLEFERWHFLFPKRFFTKNILKIYKMIKLFCFSVRGRISLRVRAAWRQSSTKNQLERVPTPTRSTPAWLSPTWRWKSRWKRRSKPNWKRDRLSRPRRRRRNRSRPLKLNSRSSWRTRWSSKSRCRLAKRPPPRQRNPSTNRATRTHTAPKVSLPHLYVSQLSRPFVNP